MPGFSSNLGLLDIIHLDRPVLRVGRGEDADIRLPHPAVSRRHAVLSADGGGLSVRDLGSRGGVFVNGKAVSSAQLQPDDVVAFGPIVFEVKAGLLRRLAETGGVTVEARGLTVLRRQRVALAGVNLTIPAGNFLGILGPSGAGKTTLLKALMGYLPAAGQVLYDGIDVEAHREACRSMVGFVPQDDVLHSTLSARKNLDFALWLRVVGDLRADERAAWVAHMLKRIKLDDVDAGRPVRTLSGGQRKRVSVAIELLSRPRLLFLDEPTAGLDPAAEALMMRFLQEIARRGTTVICATHVMESLDLFDAVVVVAGVLDAQKKEKIGRVIGSGKPCNLLSHFQVGTYAELYEKLEKLKEDDLPQRQAKLVPSAQPVAVAVRPTHSHAGMVRQVAILLQRGLLLIVRDQALLALLLGQPLLIGLLINISQVNPGDRALNPMYTFAVVASIWLGLNNTAREIVRDRAIYVRERRATVNPESYLLAKVALFACIGIVQIILLVFCLRFLHFIDPVVSRDAAKAMSNFSVPQVLLVLWLTYFSGMLLGLLISSLSPTEEVAVAVLPLVILPQLLLSGTASHLFDRPGGWFNSLDVLIAHSGAEHGLCGWLLEGLSLFTYSRPALVFFLEFYEHDKSALPAFLAAIVRWTHLLFMLLATATAFVAVFLNRERRWLQKG